MTELSTRRLVIRGRVQGVGFRYAMYGQAQLLGVHGWVRNRRDGSVEAVVAGPAQAVRQISAWARSGPPGSTVDAVDESDEPAGSFTAFAILATA